MKMEPDWSNVEAVRHYLGSLYPNSNNQTGSPMYQYLKDELAKGNKPKGRETHLSRGSKGEFAKWVVQNSGDNAFYYPDMRVTYYPEFVDPPTTDIDEDDYSRPERSERRVTERRVRSEKAKKKSKTGLNHPQPPPNPAQRRRRRSPMTDRELMRIQKERLRTLRPRRNGKVLKPV